MMIRFSLDGLPMAKGRPRFTRLGRAYTPATTVAYEKQVAEQYRKYAAVVDAKPVTVPCTLVIDARFPIPQSAKRKRIPDLIRSGEPHGHKPDLDNLVKAILDGLNGVVFTDDSLVYQISASKTYADVPGVTVTIETED